MTQWGRVPEGTGAQQEWAHLTDEQLVAGTVAGHREAFGELYRRHQRHLWATAVSTVRSIDDAQDCLQDAMLRAFVLCGEFRGDCHVASWLHRIVVNACVDRARRNRIRVTFPMPDDVSGLGSDDGRAIEMVDARVTTWGVLSRLPEEQLQAVLAVDMYDLSIEAAADALGVAPGTIKSRRARARAKLARSLGSRRAHHVVQLMGTGRDPRASN
ncbi:RNA polymerase sigma factor SigM [Tsukamurella sp. 8F]|uniref:RNA polymerase sigma factor SigM n=1 Tax=unclassified Tsukamurella TaxID=2633480 RepID=UPI0023B89BF7|nr:MULTISPECIES: RNA polymerase sigma factor SigM [unclassified Tsukamurella]MDF0529416.1 RNA polymerase sigma factor SigM [Tsukamurella sp. 8J]MDF0587077.1 RNA polymerase sigma factor SigM [Tsukamurella sp. 8F]